MRERTMSCKMVMSFISVLMFRVREETGLHLNVKSFLSEPLCKTTPTIRAIDKQALCIMFI